MKNTFYVSNPSEIQVKAKENGIDADKGSIFVYAFDILEGLIKVRYIPSPSEDMAVNITNHGIKVIYVK